MSFPIITGVVLIGLGGFVGGIVVSGLGVFVVLKHVRVGSHSKVS